ncbi:uncharacterized protein [Ciconia boyciana]|uniref:uncharacterized protein n=1 Tax=Ciconia boyciana TaxID=52775 RepID=UPI003BA3B67C
MSSSQCCWSLGSLLLLLGGNLGVLLNIHQDLVNGTVGQSVLLPLSYRFSRAPCFPVSIVWTFTNSTDTLISCTLLNCSLGAGGDPSNCSAKCFPHPAYRRRAELFPENGSLLLRDLQLSDSGVYSVSFRPWYQTQHLTLTVHEQRSTPAHPADTVKQDHISYYVSGICSAFLLLLLLFCCIRHWGAAQQKRRKIIKQQQISSVEESHMESTVVRDTAPVYASIEDSFEQSQPRPTPEVVYTSITSPGPPGLDTGPCHLLL